MACGAKDQHWNMVRDDGPHLDLLDLFVVRGRNSIKERRDLSPKVRGRDEGAEYVLRENVCE